jgi:hypothetical protein
VKTDEKGAGVSKREKAVHSSMIEAMIGGQRKRQLLNNPVNAPPPPPS